ncbi:LysR family transcriptional regulator [Pectobacterium aroidearum]|uniref:LysR family transcriptional regulator n=1 Tax=Pectobacterium aroidearum TaxID=1201031 RepID=UPI003519FEC3
MELRHLRWFVAVADELHFSRAAVCLYIELSPLSRVIRKLKKGLGAKFFVRITRSTCGSRRGRRSPFVELRHSTVKLLCGSSPQHRQFFYPVQGQKMVFKVATIVSTF